MPVTLRRVSSANDDMVVAAAGVLAARGTTAAAMSKRKRIERREAPTRDSAAAQAAPARLPLSDDGGGGWTDEIKSRSTITHSTAQHRIGLLPSSHRPTRTRQEPDRAHLSDRKQGPAAFCSCWRGGYAPHRDDEANPSIDQSIDVRPVALALARAVAGARRRPRLRVVAHQRAERRRRSEPACVARRPNRHGPGRQFNQGGASGAFHALRPRSPGTRKKCESTPTDLTHPFSMQCATGTFAAARPCLPNNRRRQR